MKRILTTWFLGVVAGCYALWFGKAFHFPEWKIIVLIAVANVLVVLIVNKFRV